MITKTVQLLPILLLTLLISACLGVEQQFEEPAAGSTTAPQAAQEAPPTEPLATIVNTPILELVTPSAEFTEEEIMPTEPNPRTTPEPESEASTAPDQTQDQPEPQPAYPSSVEPFVNLAKEDLANRQSVDMAAIEVISFESKVWPDSSLGCPQPGMMYLQVLKEGYLIQLRIGDQIYNYHGGEGRDKPFLCEQNVLPQTITKQAPLNPKETPTKEVPPPRD